MEDIKKDEKTVYCCPSKVLIMGGYAILSEQCVGLSVGLNEKFYAFVDPIVSQSIPDGNESFIKQIKFVSRQIDSQWTYKVNTNERTYQFVEDQDQDNKASRNSFLESVVQIIINECGDDICKRMMHDIQVNIFHDNRFYSCMSKKKEEQKSEIFYHFDKKNLHKTGLGSSACVVVVSIGVLLEYYNLFSLERLHYLSQKANSVAQNKIGSGFDISTSVFGSQLYTRFPPQLFSSSNLSSNPYNWNKFIRLSIPKELKVVMIDLSIGSDTRMLAGEVKKYLDQHPQESQIFYNKNNECAQRLQQLFSGVTDLDTLRQSKDNILALNKEYRQIFKQIGVCAQVETEPDALTTILDQIIQDIPQVYYGVCPGAGGYDALCLLVESSFTSLQLQQNILKIKNNNEQIKEMIIQEIDISIEGFRQLNQQESSIFFKNIY